MKLTIDTKVLSKYSLSLGEFLTLLFPYTNNKYTWSSADVIMDKLAEEDLTSRGDLILSNNTKDLVAKILMESSDKLKKSPVKDFEALATTLMEIYPKGNKAGTTYPWRGTVEDIAQKLRTLVVMHDFIFTEGEAIEATKQYVEQFPDDKTHMRLLKYFLLKTKGDEINSDFMNIIENNR